MYAKYQNASISQTSLAKFKSQTTQETSFYSRLWCKSRIPDRSKLKQSGSIWVNLNKSSYENSESGCRQLPKFKSRLFQIDPIWINLDQSGSGQTNSLETPYTQLLVYRPAQFLFMIPKDYLHKTICTIYSSACADIS